MSDSLFSSRLRLIPLEQHQLELILHNIESLEESLDLTILRSHITDRVRRAIGMKIDKMRRVNVSQHDWFTYWLIVIKDEHVGAGMLGFKGFPDENGSTEIGYGIDPAYQGKGYMSEAVQALVDWAFTHPFCNVITATEVENPASKRLLEKLGAKLVHASARSTSWEIQKVSH